jgi:hypothetical protein
MKLHIQPVWTENPVESNGPVSPRLENRREQPAELTVLLQMTSMHAPQPRFWGCPDWAIGLLDPMAATCQ